MLRLFNESLDDSRRLIETIEKALKQSAAQRKNILKAAFSGQLVPQDPNDEPASVLLERIIAERTSHAANRKTAPKTKKVSMTRVIGGEALCWWSFRSPESEKPR